MKIYFYTAVALDVSGGDNQSELWRHSEETDKIEIYAETLSLKVPLAILLGWYTNVNIRLEHVLPKSLKQRCLRDNWSNSVHIRGGLLSACHSLAAC